MNITENFKFEMLIVLMRTVLCLFVCLYCLLCLFALSSCFVLLSNYCLLSVFTVYCLFSISLFVFQLSLWFPSTCFCS